MSRLNRKAKVLVTSVGATGAQNVIKALRKQDQYEVEIIGCDASEMNPGAFLVDHFRTTPMGHENGYAEALLALCREFSVDLLVPIMEGELETVSSCSAMFAPYFPAVSDIQTIRICNDKLECNTLLSSRNIPLPKGYRSSFEASFPVIVKPRKGTGSRDIQILHDRPDSELVQNETFLIQQFVTGKEYTVDCYSAFHSDFIACVPRQRLAVKGGLSTKTLVVEHPKLIERCREILQIIPVKGPSNIQFIESEDGTLNFIELNPRFGGAYIASIEAGLNAPLFLLNERFGDPIEYSGYRKNLLMLRYWNEIFTDYLA